MSDVFDRSPELREAFHKLKARRERKERAERRERIATLVLAGLIAKTYDPQHEVKGSYVSLAINYADLLMNRLDDWAEVTKHEAETRPEQK
jgi:hypothetical protein